MKIFSIISFDLTLNDCSPESLFALHLIFLHDLRIIKSHLDFLIYSGFLYKLVLDLGPFCQMETKILYDFF